MASGGFEIRGLKRFRAMLNPGLLRREMRRKFRSTNSRLARKFEEKARADIRQGKYAKLSRITELMKGSSKPLVKTGSLEKSIDAQVVSDFEFRDRDWETSELIANS